MATVSRVALRRRFIFLAMAALLVFGVAPGLGAGADEAVTFTGCLKDSGKIDRVAIGDEPTKPCGDKDIQIAWGNPGPPGPPGLQGETGPPGPEGPPGQTQGLPPITSIGDGDDPNPLGLEMYLVLDGISGPVRDQRLRGDAFIVLGYEHEVRFTGAGHVGGGGGGGRAEHDPLAVSMDIEEGAIDVIAHLNGGSPISTGHLSVFDGGSQPLIEIELDDVLVTRADYEEESIRIEFHYEKIQWRFTPRDGSGAPAAPIVSEWNLVFNAGSGPGIVGSGVAMGFGQGTGQFLDVDSTRGETTDSGHVGWHDLVRYEHVLAHPPAPMGSPQSGPTTHENLMTEIFVDVGTPQLIHATNTGFQLDGVTVDVCLGSHCNWLVELFDAQAVRVTYSSTQQAEVEFAYTQIRWTHTDASSSARSTTWDLQANAPF